MVKQKGNININKKPKFPREKIPGIGIYWGYGLMQRSLVLWKILLYAIKVCRETKVWSAEILIANTCEIYSAFVSMQ